MKYFNGIKNKQYFEGWYFKHSSDDLNISFIPSISVNKKHEKICFIQVITNIQSTFFTFPIMEFKANKNDLFIQINNNIFSTEGITLDLQNDEMSIKAEIKYDKFTTLKKDIMGPFKNVPFMECSHRVISMKHSISGNIKLNNKNYNLNNGLGYIESDYGTSFPIHYKWIQSNDFHQDVAFFFSVAKIPYHFLSFTGFICAIIINQKEYRFATYNFSKIITDEENKIVIKKGKYTLLIKYAASNIKKLKAPTNGAMVRDIFECIDGKCSIKLTYKDNIIVNSIGDNCGIENS